MPPTKRWAPIEQQPRSAAPPTRPSSGPWRRPERPRRLRAAEVAVAHNYDDGDHHHRRAGGTHRRPDLGQALLPVVRAAGYAGSARNLRRAVAEAKAKWRRRPSPGTSARGVGAGRHAGVRLGGDRPAVRVLRRAGLEPVPLRVLRRQPGGRDAPWRRWPSAWRRSAAVPKTLLTDRMGCLKGATVAGLVVPTPDYVRFVTHYGTRPDFC